MTRRKAVLLVFAVTVACIGVFSAVRIMAVNAEFDALVDDKASSSFESKGDDSSNSGLTLLQYDEGDAIPMDSLTVEGKTVPVGITYSVSNARIETEEAIMESYGWSGVPADENYQRYDAPLFLSVDVTINNAGDATYQPVWFDLEAGSWSTVRYPELMYVLNGFDDAADFAIATGDSRTFAVAYMLWEPTFSADQWSNVRNLDYCLTCLDYPKKIVVRVGGSLT